MKTRRENAVLKFAQKTLKNPRYADRWFPKRDIVQHTRANNPYIEEQAKGSRLYNSPLFSMRRLMNGSESDNVVDLSGIFNCPF